MKAKIVVVISVAVFVTVMALGAVLSAKQITFTEETNGRQVAAKQLVFNEEAVIQPPFDTAP
jgi:hypothetical protein